MSGFITGLPAAGTLDGAELVEISQLSTSVTITATTLSAQASDNSYNDSGAGFIAAGFAVDDRVKVVGFTGNTANNILVGTIATLTTSKMTIASPEGDVIVDDAAGESVTITKWESRRAAFGGSELGALADVDLASLADGDGLYYDASLGAWVNDTPPAGGGGGSVSVEDDGTEVVATASTLNFTGLGVNASDAGGGQVDIDIPGGGIGNGWVLAGSGSATGSSPNVNVPLDSDDYDELLILGRGMTASASGNRSIRFSTDGGSTYYSASGDIHAVAATGVETDGSVADFTSTSAATALSIIGHIKNNQSEDRFYLGTGSRGYAMFDADSLPINAVQFTAGSGNMTGGTFEVYGRKSAAAPVPFKGAMAILTADDTGQDYSSNPAISWDGVDYDTSGFWSASNASRLTVPAGVRKIRLIGNVKCANLTFDDYVRLWVTKNGSVEFNGHPTAVAEAGTSGMRIALSSAILEVTPGDYFELILDTESDTSIDLDQHGTHFAIEVVEVSAAPAFIGARVGFTADQTAQNYSTTDEIDWNDEVFDTGGLFDIGAPDRFTIQEAGYYEYGCTLDIENITTAPRIFGSRKNSSDVAQGSLAQAAGITVGGDVEMLVLTSGPVWFDVGDYASIRLTSGGDTSITLQENGCQFWIKRLG